MSNSFGCTKNIPLYNNLFLAYAIRQKKRRGESCRRIHSPLFALRRKGIGIGIGIGGGRVSVSVSVSVAVAVAVAVVGANHAGEFIRRYSPLGGRVSVAVAVAVVGANHAGEFIRRYSPLVSSGRIKREIDTNESRW
jgi:hypothetical protein